MPNLNTVLLMGNLTRAPELRYTPKGMAVAEFGLALNRKFNVEGEVREEVTFVDVTFWGRQAETLAQYVKKGAPLFIEGRLQQDTWDDKTTGQKRTKLRIVGEGFQFLEGKQAGGAESDAPDHAGGLRSPAPPRPHSREPDQGAPEDEDNLPS